MTEHFTVGDILRGAKHEPDAAWHPIIFLEDFDQIHFLGGMITHSPRFGNKKLSDVHFEIVPPSNKSGHKYFVKEKLLKKNEWGPFTKIGQLSKEGIDYVKGTIDDLKPRLWSYKGKAR